MKPHSSRTHSYVTSSSNHDLRFSAWRSRSNSSNNVSVQLTSSTSSYSSRITKLKKRFYIHRRQMMRRCRCIWISWSRRLMIWRRRNRYWNKRLRRKRVRRWGSRRSWLKPTLYTTATTLRLITPTTLQHPNTSLPKTLTRAATSHPPLQPNSNLSANSPKSDIFNR